MSEPTAPAAVQVAESTPAAVPAAESLTPQASERAAVYERIYGAPVAEPAVAEPVAVTPAPTSDAPPDYKTMFEQLANEVAGLRQALTPPPAEVPAELPADWFALLQAGKRTEAENAMKSMVAKGASQEIVQQAVSQALETIRVQETVNSINNDLRVQNPDLVPFERWIALDAELRFNAIRGGIKSSDDYVKAYTKVVNEATGEVRKQLQLARAAGANEARTIQKEVIASSTLAPNSIISVRETPPVQDETPDVSAQSYLTQRMQRNSGLRGLQ